MSFMTREDTAFVVIDFQEKLMPAMSDKEILEDKTVRLVKGMKTLGIPAVVTQQYTKGIGHTIPSIAEALGEFEPVDKTTFSCMKNEEFITRFRALDRKNIVVCGIEAHICVQQTVLQLLEEGYNVYVPADCISSRSPEDKMWSISRMGEAGAVITSYEAVLYEILGGSKEEGFKQISAIVK
ncbi:MAG: hydrolase [Firmicutes bacterium]|nr:hydrolase [Bacillota bacterium]